MLFYLQKLFVTKKNELLLEIKFDNLIMLKENIKTKYKKIE